MSQFDSQQFNCDWRREYGCSRVRNGCHVTARGSRVRGDESYITECGNDVVYQAAYGNGVMYWSQLQNVFLGTYNITVLNIC